MLCEHLRELQQEDGGYIYGGDSSSYAGSNDSSTGDDDYDDTPGWLQRELMALLSPRFPPAALALQQLMEADDVTDAGNKAARFVELFVVLSIAVTVLFIPASCGYDASTCLCFSLLVCPPLPTGPSSS